MTTRDAGGHERRGAIAYMVRNGVAANLLMLFIVAAGILSLTGLVQEAFPEMSFGTVEVSVRYPGAAPEEVEQSIVIKIEEQVRNLSDVREVTAVAAEGIASVLVELKMGTDISRALDDITSAVNRIQTFPVQAERPEIGEMTNRQSVMRLVLYGDVSERALKELAYRTEDALGGLPEVSRVETSGVRNYEISIEVPLQRLQSLGLTLEDVSEAVRRGSLDLSAGRIETLDEHVRVRTTGQRHNQQDFEELIVLARNDGTVVRLGDIARVRDGFQNSDLIVRYQGQPAAFVEVYRAADEQVLDVTRAVKEFLTSDVIPSLPAGTGITIWNNDADTYRERLFLLLKNGFLGLLLVLLGLAVFLEIRLAFWVALGIAVSGAGALSAMLITDVSINTISLFAFILAIGIVVDDAIVVAENIHHERMQGTTGVLAAIRGTRRVSRPLIFAVLTSVAAFSPLLFIPGGLGELMRAVPVILIAMLLTSLVESLLVLPHHLSDLPGPEWRPSNIPGRICAWGQTQADRGLHWFVEGPLHQGLALATRHPPIMIAAGLAAIILSIALVPAGIVRVNFGQKVEGDIATANLRMPAGTTAQRTHDMARELEAAGRRAIERLSRSGSQDAAPLLTGVSRAVGVPQRMADGAVQEASLDPPANVATVEFKLLASEQRDVSTDTFLQMWREEVGPLPEARGLAFSAELLGLGLPVEVALSHPDPERLDQLADAVVAELRKLQGVFGVQSDHAAGLQEIRLDLRTEARTLGLTLDELAHQTRSAFFGTEALRLQRGREEVRVLVRLPPEERDAIADIERYLIRTPAGAAIPLSQVATVNSGNTPLSIRRRNGRRVITITADVDGSMITAGEANDILATSILSKLADSNPGFAYQFGGEQQQQSEFRGGLLRGFVLALLVIYALLAIPLASYVMPLIVMCAVPFGVIGAILGHWILGIEMTFASTMGTVALCGVVVNDSLVMIDFISQRLREGIPVRTAIVEGAKGRFRPIMLTSLTTFLGFTPLLLETAPQAQFLIPFGASVGFGVLIATPLLMLVVPALTTVYFQVAPSRRPRAVHLATGG